MSDSPRWPLRWPYFRILALLLSLASLGGFVHLWCLRAPLLESYYLPTYLRTTLPEVPFWRTYTILETKNNVSALPSDEGELHPVSLKLGHDQLRNGLRDEIYGGRPLYSVLRWPLMGFIVVLVTLMRFGALLDRSINSEARDGRLIRGPRIISHWLWNLKIPRKRRGLFIETR